MPVKPMQTGPVEARYLQGWKQPPKLWREDMPVTHKTFDGLSLAVQFPTGSVRTGMNADGTAWTRVQKADYGYIENQPGTDGDYLDFYLNPAPVPGSNVYVVNQNVPGSTLFDEHKVLLGFPNLDEARAAYLVHYPSDWQGLATITTFTPAGFKNWLQNEPRDLAATRVNAKGQILPGSDDEDDDRMDWGDKDDDELCPECGAIMTEAGSCPKCGTSGKLDGPSDDALLYDREFTEEKRKDLAAKGAAMPGGCLAAETLVFTEHGTFPISEMVGNVRLLTDDGWQDSEIRSFGIGELNAVVLERNGESRTVYATPNHRWLLVSGEWVETWQLTTTDFIPYVPTSQVTDNGFESDLFNSSECSVTRGTEKPTDNPCGMVMVDVQPRPLFSTSGVSVDLGHTTAQIAPSTLECLHKREIFIRDAVFPLQFTLPPNKPTRIPVNDTGFADNGFFSDTELALCSPSVVPSMEICVRKSLPTQATSDIPFVFDGHTRVLGGIGGTSLPLSRVVHCAQSGSASPCSPIAANNGTVHGTEVYPIFDNWRVLSVEVTGRIEEVFCAVVPGLHRFVLDGGILTGNSYPIESEQDLKNAIHAIGRAKNRAATIAHIKKRARALGLTNLIPEEWGHTSSGKASSDSLKTKAQVNYRDATGAQKCGNCKYYSNYECSKVSGAIQPADVCDLYSKGTAATDNITVNQKPPYHRDTTDPAGGNLTAAGGGYGEFSPAANDVNDPRCKTCGNPVKDKAARFCPGCGGEVWGGPNQGIKADQHDNTRTALREMAKRLPAGRNRHFLFYHPTRDALYLSKGDGWERTNGNALPPHDIRTLFRTVPGIRSVELGQNDTPPDQDDNWQLVGYTPANLGGFNKSSSGYTPYENISVVSATRNDSTLAADSEFTGNPAYDDFVPELDDWELISDSAKDGLMRVRQKLSRADSRNRNNRIYPKAVLQAAADEARPYARAKAMISEWEHPPVATIGQRQYYVDRPEMKTARVDEFESVQTDNWLWIERTILDTPYGRKVADGYATNHPMGISTRFTMVGRRATVDNLQTDIASRIRIHSADDVTNPAVVGAGTTYELLTDSVRDALEHYTTDAATGLLLPASGRRLQTMKEKLNQARKNVLILVNKRAEKQAVADARQRLRDLTDLAADETGIDLLEEMNLNAKVDEAMAISGFHGDRPGPMGVKGNETGIPDGPPFAEESRTNETAPPSGGGPHVAVGADANAVAAAYTPVPGSQTPVSAPTSQAVHAADQALLDYFRNKKAEEDRAAADSRRKDEIRVAWDSLDKTEALKGLNADEQEYIRTMVCNTATDAAQLPSLFAAQLEAFSKIMSRRTLEARGYRGDSSLQGRTTEQNNTGNGYVVNNGYTEVREAMHPCFDSAYKHIRGQVPACFQPVNKILLAGDDAAMRTQGANSLRPDDPKLQKRRVENLRKLWPILNDIATRFHSAQTIEEWFAAKDSITNVGEKAFCDAFLGEMALADATTTSNMWNQPTILTALLIQAFWNMTMFQFVEGVGPAMATEAGAGWFRQALPSGEIGSVLRLPVEFVNYGSMSGYAGKPLPAYDPGLLVPENTGIDEIIVSTRWLSYQAQWRRIAAQPTRDAIRAMGNGPLNYPIVGRELFHMGYAHSRTTDISLANEMWQIGDEYNAVIVTAESPNFANNSVYAASNVTVNLNPSKAASASVAAGDPGVQYGTNVVGAIRLQTKGNGTSVPYAGEVVTNSTAGMVPIVRPRATNDLNAAGQVTANATQNPFTVTVTGGTGAAPVQGTFDVNSGVVNFAGGTGANFAVDYNNGVIVFTAGFTAYANNSGVLQAALSSTTTITYSYLNNYDRFVVNNPVIPVGQGYSDYLAEIVGTLDNTAATLASYPNYMEPDLVLMSIRASTYFTRSRIFWEFLSPKGTELFPTDDYFAVRTNLRLARTNTPWFVGDSRVLVTQKGSTKLGIDTPWEIRGPQFPTDSNGKPIAREVYYGESNMVIATPQVQDQSSPPVILNHVAREILLT